MEALAQALPASLCPFAAGAVETDNKTANNKHYIVVGNRIKITATMTCSFPQMPPTPLQVPDRPH